MAVVYFSNLNIAPIAGTPADNGSNPALTAGQRQALVDGDLLVSAVQVLASPPNALKTKFNLGRQYRLSGKNMELWDGGRVLAEHGLYHSTDDIIYTTLTNARVTETLGQSGTIGNARASFYGAQTMVWDDASPWLTTMTDGVIPAGQTSNFIVYATDGNFTFRLVVLRVNGATMQFIGGSDSVVVNSSGTKNVSWSTEVRTKAGDMIGMSSILNAGTYCGIRMNNTDVAWHLHEKAKYHIWSTVTGDTALASWTVNASPIPDLAIYNIINNDAKITGQAAADVYAWYLKGELVFPSDTTQATSIRMFADANNASWATFGGDTFKVLSQGFLSVFSSWQSLGNVLNAHASKSSTINRAYINAEVSQFGTSLSASDKLQRCLHFKCQIATSIAGAGAVAHCTNNNLADFVCSAANGNYWTLGCGPSCADYSRSELTLDDLAAGASDEIFIRYRYKITDAKVAGYAQVVGLIGHDFTGVPQHAPAIIEAQAPAPYDPAFGTGEVLNCGALRLVNSCMG